MIESLPDGLHADGGNLYLRKRGGSRSWIFRYKLNYKTFELGLGSAYVVPLAEARKKALNLRHDIVNGVYPQVRLRIERKKTDDARRVALADTVTLDEILEPALAHHVEMKRIRTKHYIRDHANAIRKHFADVCYKPLSLITTEEIAKGLKPFFTTSSSTKYLAVFRLCFDYAKMKGLYAGENPALKSSGLGMYLPTGLGESKKHHQSLDWKDVPELYAKLCKKNTMTCVTLRLVILTACRLSEINRLQECDVDLDRMVFTCRSTKTSSEPVKFPLPWQAKELFSNFRLIRACSPNIKAYIRGIGYPGMTVHGFRASFSTWCAENGKDPEMRERCLGHAVDTKVAACYQRSDLLERRRALIQEWADYVTGSSSDQ